MKKTLSMILKMTMLVFGVAMILTVGGHAKAQGGDCPDCVQISDDDTGNITVSVPGTVGGIFVPGGGVIIDTSCDGLVVTIPIGRTVRVNVHKTFPVTVNDKKLEESGSMDPLPYEITFPQGGHIWIQRKQLSGVRQANIKVGGTNLTVTRAKAMGPKVIR
jgi:hypothetical protein